MPTGRATSLYFKYVDKLDRSEETPRCVQLCIKLLLNGLVVSASWLEYASALAINSAYKYVLVMELILIQIAPSYTP